MREAVPLLIVLFTVPFAATVFADEDPVKFTPRGAILDKEQKPVAEAQITLHCWKDSMSPAIQLTTTDADGHFEFPKKPDDASFYFVIRKPPYAAILKKSVSTDPAAKVILRPAVDSWVQVRNAAGSPLQGGRITNISVRTPENAMMYVKRGMEHLLGWEFTASDDAGRLNLPPLPEGAIIDTRIDHPLWAQAKLSNLSVAEGQLNAVSFPAGVMTTFEFVADPRTPMNLDGLTCETLLFSESSQSAETLN